MIDQVGNLVYAYFNASKTPIVGQKSGCQIYPPDGSIGCFIVRYEPDDGNDTYMHRTSSNHLNSGETVILPTFVSDEGYTFLTGIRTGRRNPSVAISTLDYSFRMSLAANLVRKNVLFIPGGEAVTFFTQTDNTQFDASFCIAEVRL